MLAYYVDFTFAYVDTAFSSYIIQFGNFLKL